MLQKKICMLGAFSVGKTSLVRRYVESIFSDAYLTTVGVYFTIWYGVYDRVTRQLEYAAAGHPPAVLVVDQPEGGRRIEQLQGRGPSLGITADAIYRSRQCVLPSPSRLFLFSDGTYEIRTPDGAMLDFDRFLDVLAPPAKEESELDRLLNFMLDLHGPGPLEDDFSIVKLEF